MKRPMHLLFVIALALAAFGCSSKDSTVAGSGSGSGSGKGSGTASGGGASATSDIIGKWKGDIKMPETNKDDPMAKMGEAMAQMFLGNLTLEFVEGGKFKLTMMGMPVEGSVSRKGNEIELTPETVLGMTVEEARKMNAENKGAELMKNDEPMLGTISADGSEITLKGKSDKSGGEMVFKRAKDEPEKPVKSTVAAAEQGFVGEWGAEMEGAAPASMTDKEKQEWKMAEMMVKSATLNLRADNTFRMTLMFDFEGTWKKEGDVLVLKMTKALGMDGGTPSADNEDLKLRSEAGGSRLISDQPGPGGAKLVFVKK